MSVVYLIHFDRPYKHARHYIGFTDDLARRVQCHRDGTGARLMQVIGESGIPWKVVRTWDDASRTFERRLKRRKNASKLCPVCRAKRGAA